MELMKAEDLDVLLQVIERCILARSHYTIHYLYIHMLGKIRMDGRTDLIPSDTKTLELLLSDPRRTSPIDEVCRKALENDVYPDLPSEHLAEIEKHVIRSALPRSYPIQQELQRARDSGYL